MIFFFLAQVVRKTKNGKMASHLDFSVFKEHLQCGRFDNAKRMITPENAKCRHPWRNLSIPAFFCAFGPDDKELLQYFIDVCGEPARDRHTSCGLLQQLTLNDKPKTLRAMLDSGIDADIGYAEGYRTPLDCSLWEGGCHWECAKILLDAGATKHSLRDGASTIVKFYLLQFDSFLANRERARCASIAVLCLLKSGSRVLFATHNGVDVLRVIARCVWETRSQTEEWSNAQK